MGIIFTKQAELKFGDLEEQGFKITKEQVEDAINNPENVIKDERGHLISQQAIDETHIIRVIYEKEGDSMVGIKIEEERILVREEVHAACEMLGFDPLYVANEGKLVAIVTPEDAETVLNRIRQNTCGKDAAVIGEVRQEHPGRVVMRTRLGTSRIIDMLVGELLPCIC